MLVNKLNCLGQIYEIYSKVPNVLVINLCFTGKSSTFARKFEYI